MIPEALHLLAAAVYMVVLAYLTLVVRRSGRSLFSRFATTSSGGIITLGSHHVIESSFSDGTMKVLSEALEATAFGILAVAMAQLYAFARRISAT